MRTIDIQTTQNVMIQYALAPVRDRLLAFVIDVVVLIAGIIILSFLIDAIFPPGIDNYVYIIILTSFFFFYSLASEILMNGQSIGKRLMGLKIVKITGKEPAPFDFVIRWAFRVIDIWGSLGSIAVMLISSTDRNQRLGDMLANTAVIKLNPWASVRLNEILSIKTIDSYQPIYPQVKQLSEQDMLFIKQATDRFKRYKNNSHRKALDALAEKLADELGLTQPPANKLEFLTTLVNDYVVLSR